jgi:hypothetical protein
MSSILNSLKSFRSPFPLLKTRMPYLQEKGISSTSLLNDPKGNALNKSQDSFKKEQLSQAPIARVSNN